MAPTIDEHRFDDLFAAHHADVLAFAMRRIDGRGPAEDVVSETFAIAWRHRGDIPDEPLGWLYAIARRALANERRGGKRRLRLLQRLSQERGEDSRSLDPAWLVDQRESILSAFSRLTVGEREVLMLVAWDGADAETACRALECSPTAFRVRLHRARRALEREAQDGESSPAIDPAVTQTAKETR